MTAPGENAISSDEFDRLWKLPLTEVARDAVTQDKLRARRMILEARVAQASDEMVRWTKIAIVLSLSTSTLSIIVAVIALFVSK